MTFPKRYERKASPAALAALFSIALFGGAQAQPQPDRRQLHRELAHAKAERFARMQAGFRAQIASQAHTTVENCLRESGGDIVWSQSLTRGRDCLVAHGGYRGRR